jgi:hypothetical protein
MNANTWLILLNMVLKGGRYRGVAIMWMLVFFLFILLVLRVR